MNPEEAPDAAFPWNAYVKAVVAFLDGDLNELQLQREYIRSTLTRANLQIVDALIERFHLSYREASPYSPD
jgi:hypothetical protein